MYITKKDPAIIPVSELIEKSGIPRPFLRKILQILNREGVLHSNKGKGGGFQLVIPPDQILLTNLIKIFQGPVKLNECIFKKSICPDIKTCALKRKIDALESYVINELKSISLASLIEENRSS